LAESTTVFFSGVVKQHKKGYFGYGRKKGYKLVHIQDDEMFGYYITILFQISLQMKGLDSFPTNLVQIIHSLEYVTLNFAQ
jgi:hypothetical protein